MNNEATVNSDYRHPKHDAIARMLLDGARDKTIAAELHVDRRAAARVRLILGIAPRTNGTTKGDKLDRFATEPNAAGHIGWTGRRSNGAPVIRHLGKQYPASAVAFERRTGRAPVGQCKAECEFTHCLNGSHISDVLERRRVRLQLRAVEGLPAHWETCPEGHSWDEHGRVYEDLELYCQCCNTERARRVRDARIEEDGS